MARGRRGRPKQNASPTLVTIKTREDLLVLRNPNSNASNENISVRNPGMQNEQRIPTSTYASLLDPEEGLALKFDKATVINGAKVPKIEQQDVATEIEYWNQPVICSVLGANPPIRVIEGVVDTNTISSLPIWVQFPELDVKYWGADSLSKLGSIFGIPLKSDKQTMKKTYLNYARHLIDISLDNPFPDYVDFISDRGIVTR
ncbi:hypothetical protein Cgig2_004362 [Carnegiea gigantea]|uniref:DUF4283 domain-containing protein n=1 Tax=Carnegiea gigantea TaxID=171969 RepID=A0A9Q1JNJ7_9CARY|nr:hypothetical protein Cgig2_004362 [Carnegiea gigantea]